MNKTKKSKNIINIGFIDLLTGFLCSTAALMIIIKYGAEQQADIAGGPKDYLFYEGVIEYANPEDRFLGIENALVQIIIKTPEGEWIESELLTVGMDYNEDGFIAFNHPDFYGLGPALKEGQSDDKLFFHVYGLAYINQGDTWEVGMRYYANNLLEEKRQNLGTNEMNRVLLSQLKVTHKVQHIALAEEAIVQEEGLLALGNDSQITVSIANPNLE